MCNCPTSWHLKPQRVRARGRLNIDDQLPLPIPDERLTNDDLYPGGRQLLGA